MQRTGYVLFRALVKVENYLESNYLKKCGRCIQSARRGKISFCDDVTEIGSSGHERAVSPSKNCL